MQGNPSSSVDCSELSIPENQLEFLRRSYADRTWMCPKAILSGMCQ